MVTQEKLKELFYLDESIYKLLRRTKAGPRALAGAIAGPTKTREFWNNWGKLKEK